MEICSECFVCEFGVVLAEVVGLNLLLTRGGVGWCRSLRCVVS